MQQVGRSCALIVEGATGPHLLTLRDPSVLKEMDELGTRRRLPGRTQHPTSANPPDMLPMQAQTPFPAASELQDRQMAKLLGLKDREHT